MPFELAPINPDYQCTMVPVTQPTILKSETFTLKGTHVEIPSRNLFITEDGSVYVVMKRKGKVADYASLDSLIETIKKTTILEGFSTPK